MNEMDLKFSIFSNQYSILEFDDLDVYFPHTLNRVPWHIKLVLEFVLKLKKCQFFSLQTILNCQKKNDISWKSSIGVSSNSISRFLNFALKIRKQKV